METGSEVADGQSVTRRRGCSVQTGLSFLSASKASEKVKVKSLSCVRLFATPRTVACHGIFQARVLEWIAISFSRGPSQPRNQTWVSRIADRCFTVGAIREALCKQFISPQDTDFLKNLSVHSISSWYFLSSLFDYLPLFSFRLNLKNSTHVACWFF